MKNKTTTNNFLHTDKLFVEERDCRVTFQLTLLADPDYCSSTFRVENFRIYPVFVLPSHFYFILYFLRFLASAFMFVSYNLPINILQVQPTKIPVKLNIFIPFQK